MSVETKTTELTEQSMRADPNKQRKYQRLAASPYLADVVDANRAYLAAAVEDSAVTERDYWTLSCLSGHSTVLSRISMATMETFVVQKPDDDNLEVQGFVVVVRSLLEQGFGSAVEFERRFPGLLVIESDYRAAGIDQARVFGPQSTLSKAFQVDPFAAAALALAQKLMLKRTVYRSGHNYMLADHVLKRAGAPVSPRQRSGAGESGTHTQHEASDLGRPYSGPADDGEYPEHQATNAEAHRRAAAEHHRICTTVVEYMAAKGVAVWCDLHRVPVDLAWHDSAGNQVIAEVKSCTDENGVHQLRLGLGQIVEYRTRLSSAGVSAEGLLIVAGTVDGYWYDVCDSVGIVLVNLNEDDGLAALDAFVEEPAELAVED